MRDFSWGFDEEPLDPKLALANAAIEADAAAESEHDYDPEAEDALETEEVNGEEYEEPPLPAPWQAFRNRARVNTYTVIGPELALHDYPLRGERLDQYPTAFGVNSHRARTIGTETIG